MQLVGRRYDTGEIVRVVFSGDQITSIRAVSDTNDAPWIAPGLIDIQLNGYGGQEFGAADLTIDKVTTIVRQIGSHGVSRFCPTVTTQSFDVLAHALRALDAACRESDEVADRVLGIHLEGPYISAEDGPRGAHPREHCKPPDWDEFCRLQDAASGRIRIITLSPEYDGSAEFITQAAKAGVVVAIGHTVATPDQIRSAVDAGARLSTHLGNGAHGTLPRHPNYIWSQLADDRLAASLIVDGHHLPPEVVQSFVRAKTPERCILVSDLSGLAGLPPGRYETSLCELEILDDGCLVLAGQRQYLAGASRPLCDGVANVMRFAGVDLATAVDMASRRPLELLGKPVTELSPESRGDLVLFELPGTESGETLGEVRVVTTIAGGHVVYQSPTKTAPEIR
jgi:N-acetylglucosamine-6-phosphate deacetylase